MNRQFLNLVVKNLSTGVHSLRRITLADHLFFPSTSAAQTATAQTSAAIKANAEFQTGYKDGMRSLKAAATSLGPLPPAAINFQPTGLGVQCEPSLDFVSLLGDEGRTLCVDGSGCTSLYDAETNSILTVPSLRASKGRDAISIPVTRAADGCGKEYDRLYVMRRRPCSELREYCFEELSYGGQDLFGNYEGLIHGWTPLPPPPFVDYHCLKEDIGTYTVVGGSTIYVSSSTEQGFDTFAFDTELWRWRRVGKWLLPFSDNAEYVPELNLWFGLSSSNPVHLCASDLSSVDYNRPPVVDHYWVDLDMLPKRWSPFRQDLIDLGSGRFCICKVFSGTSPPPFVLAFSGDEDEDDGLLDDATDWINSDFVVFTGIEVVRCDGNLQMIKHMSRFHMLDDHRIEWVL